MVRAEAIVDGWEHHLRKKQESDDSSAAEVEQCLHEDVKILLNDIMFDSQPLIVQLCSSSPNKLYEASRVLLQLQHIVGLDFNLGCPQKCAQTGNFGAFLADSQPDLALDCVAAMRRAIDDDNYEKPNKTKAKLSCKIRLRNTTENTLQFARRLHQQGCERLTIHCRRRHDKHDGPPDYVAAVALTKALRSLNNFQIIINGSINSVDDARKVLHETKADGVMIARGFLANPLLFCDVSSPTSRERIMPLHMAARYLDHAELQPPPSHLYIQTHLRWIFRGQLRPKDEDDDSALNWKIKIWTVLVRPYLTGVEQFRCVLGLLARYMIEEKSLSYNEIPLSLGDYVHSTFQEIRYGRDLGTIDAAIHTTEGLALGLFD
jgi:tRNA-dihydrouridine synthase